MEKEILKENTENQSKKLSVGQIFARIGVISGTVIGALLITVTSVALLAAYGPSESFRNSLVISAKQASATKWIPDLFLGRQKAEEIFSKSKDITEEIVPIPDGFGETDADEWENHPDGTRIDFLTKPKFKAYMMVIKDPAKVHVGVSSENFSTATFGLRVFDMVKKYEPIAAINGGEFPDDGGWGRGQTPIGITYSFGKKVWDDGARRTFIGLDNNNKLICREGLTAAQAEQLGIRDGVCFQTGNVLIEPQGDSVKLNYRGTSTGTAQRTAIGQRADGAILFLVTDGRSSESIGATPNDLIDIMVEYGAVSAGMLDGGSSAMMYSKDYITKYGVDTSVLDEYQKQGLVNRYKALTKPRYIPTYFIVTGE